MIIDDYTMAKWAALKTSTDVARIQDKYLVDTGEQISDQSIRNVFANGKASDDLFYVMEDYYNDKIDTIKQFI